MARWKTTVHPTDDMGGTLSRFDLSPVSVCVCVSVCAHLFCGLHIPVTFLDYHSNTEKCQYDLIT